MTCIVGVETKGEVWIGGDSAISGWTVEIMAGPKVFRAGKFLFGVSGSARVSGLLQHAFDPPKPPKRRDGALDRFMLTEFVPALRGVLGDHGAQSKTDDVASIAGGTAFLVGVRGRLFEVHSDYQVGSRASGYYSVGSGYRIALGALFAADVVGDADGYPALADPAERVRLALAAAAEHDPYVRAPFVVEKL